MTTEPTEDLLTALSELPVQPGAALRLLRMLDDPRTSAEALGQVIERDPALSMQVIRLANTSYYGLSDPVASAWRAVTVVGLATVRSIATSTAFGLFDDDGLPEGYWDHSLATASAAAAIARRIGIQPGDAFSVGLLQDLGRALIARRAARTHELINERLASCSELTIVAAEESELGFGHPDITARALAAMRFPEETIEATRKHHVAPESVELPLARLLYGADLIAEHVRADADDRDRIAAALATLAITEDEVDRILEETGEELERLAGFLTIAA
jgi:HD-like signal output (HDOD) protein